MRMIRVTAMAAMLAAVLPSSEAALSVDQVVDRLLSVEKRMVNFMSRAPILDYEVCRGRDFCELTMCGTDNENQGQSLAGGEAIPFSCDVFPGTSNTGGCAATGGGIDSDPSCQAGWLNADRSSTLFLPPGVKDDERLSEFVCNSRGFLQIMIDTDFFGYYNTFTQKFDRLLPPRYGEPDGVVLGYAVAVHSYTGAFRTFPGILTKGTPQECAAQDFDPRLKPWFVAAATGVKDIVLVVDRSGSMGWLSNSSDPTSPSRMDVTRKAFKRLLSTYTASDNVAVVAFNRTAEILGPRQGTIHGTQENLALLQAALDPLEADGGTNYTEALTVAFQALQNPPDSDPGCVKMIVFLTDGLPNDEPEAIKAKLAELQASQGEAIIDKVMLFTVGMATLDGQDILQQLACENRGAWSFVNDGEDPLEKMSGYFDLAAAANPPPFNGKGVRCTNPYDDDFGLGMVVTCGFPQYYQVAGEANLPNTVNHLDSFRMIDGVFGVDVTRATFEDTPLSVIEAGVRKFNRDPLQCEKVDPLTECALQMIRGNATRVEPYNCPAPAPAVANCPIFTHSGNNEELPAIFNYRGPYTHGWRATVQQHKNSLESQQEIPTVASLLCEAWDFEKGIPQVIPVGKETRTDCCCYTGPLDGAVIPGTAAAMPAGSTLQAAAIAAVVAVVGCLVAA